MGLSLISFLLIAVLGWVNVLVDTNFWLATLLTESGGLQLEVVLVDTVSEVLPLSSGNSLKIGWGGLLAHGEGVLDVDLSRFFIEGGTKYREFCAVIRDYRLGLGYISVRFGNFVSHELGV